MARPTDRPDGIRRNRYVQFMVTDDELAVLKQCAQTNGLSIAALARNVTFAIVDKFNKENSQQ